MKYLDILYYLVALMALAYGIAGIVNGIDKPLISWIIVGLGLYFTWRGTQITRARRARRNYHSDDSAND